MAFTLNQDFWKQRVKGDIAIYYRWEDNQPCMTLYPAYPGLAVRPSGVDFTMDVAYTLAGGDGNPTAGLMQRLEKAAIVMGLFPDKWTCRRIADAIVEGIPDLLEMPPFPPASFVDDRKGQEVLGEGLIKVAGKEIYRGEVTAGDLNQ